MCATFFRCAVFVAPLALVTACSDWDSLLRCNDGRCADAATPSACEGNLLQQASFEGTTAGWHGSSNCAEIDLAAGKGRLHGDAARVCAKGEASCDQYAIEQDVGAAKVGATYRLSGWVASAGDEQSFGAYYDMNGDFGGGELTDVGATWFEVSVTFTLSAEPLNVRLNAIGQPPIPAGTCFYADDACLQPDE